MKRKYLWQASVSLFLALILPSTVFFLLAGLRFADERKKESDAVRALSAAQELLLAQYSRKLWREYGLWAYAETETDMTPAQEIYGRKGGRITLEAASPLWEDGQMRDQIIRFMRLRAPAFAGAELLRRIRSAADERTLIHGQSSLAAVRNAHQGAAAEEAYSQGGKAVADYTESETPQEGKEAWKEIGEGARTELEGSLRSFSRHILPVYEAGGTRDIRAEEAFSPSNIEKMASSLDFLLDQGIGIHSDRICLAQYALSYFPSEVHLEREGGAIRLLRTPNGQSMQELKQKRPAEAEQIASGRMNAEEAKRDCRYAITLFRFIPRYIASFRDPGLQAKYARWSEVLSAVLSVASLGSAEIPPPALQYFIRLAHSLYLAHQDVKKLLDGYALPFWPAHSKDYLQTGPQYSLYYRDYLYLYLIAQSPEKITQSLERIIRKNMPGAWYTAGKVRFEDRNIRLEQEAEYLHD